MERLGTVVLLLTLSADDVGQILQCTVSRSVNELLDESVLVTELADVC